MARQSEMPLTVRLLMDQMVPHAEGSYLLMFRSAEFKCSILGSVSPAIRQEVISAIRHYLDTQIEK